MRIRAHRLKLIERLIEDREISSQDQLQELLKAEGFTVTQATLSRDLHRLKAYRIVTDTDKLRYVISKEVENPLDAEARRDIARGLLSFTVSHNIAVIRTPLGFAQMFAMAFERLAFEETLGVIAGLDTVFIVLQENTDIEDYKNRIKIKVPEVRLLDNRTEDNF